MKKMKKILWVLFLCLMTVGIFRTEGSPGWSTREVWAAETLAAPTLSRCAFQKKGTMNLEISWKAVDGAEGYRVYRKISSSKWTAVKTIKGTKTLSYVDTTCKTGTLYTYTVKAYKKENGETVWGNYDKTGTKGVVLEAPKLVSITADKSSVTIKWNPVSYASGYYIYCFDEEDGWVQVGTVSGKNTTSYTDKEPLIGWKQYYTVCAYKKSGSKSYAGDYDTVGLGTIITMAPKKVSAMATEIAEITVTWDKLYNVDGCRVYRKKNGGSWSRLATLKGDEHVSYKDTNVKLGDKYCYKVRAWKYMDGTKYWSSYTLSDSITMQIPAPKLLSAEAKSTTSIQVQWQSIDGVYGYRVYRRYKGATTWKSLATFKGAQLNSYTDTTVECGRTYEYTVRAYIRQNGEKVWGTYDKTGVSVEIKIPAPKLVSAKASGQTSLVLKWKNVATADGYRVYKKEGGEWTRIATIQDGSKTSYTVKGLDVGSVNTFTVRAYKKIDGKTVLGKYSSSGIVGKTIRGTLKLSCTTLYVVAGHYSYDLKFEGTTEKPQWSSSNSEIVRVDSSGCLYGAKAGTAIITAVFEGVEYKCTVIVEKPTLVAKKEIIGVGESTYITMTGTSREVKWCTPENGYAKLKEVDTYKVKITGKKIGEETIKAVVGNEDYYIRIIVKGEINTSYDQVDLKVGETIEVSITSTYSELLRYTTDSSIVDTELTELGNGKWTLKLTGLNAGEAEVEIGTYYYKDELNKKINVTVKDPNTVSSNNFKLKRYIKNNGSYSDGWYTISYAGYMEDVPGIIYIWTISYNETSDQFEYALALQSEDELLCMIMTGNPTKSKTMKLEYIYETASGEEYLIAQSSLNRKTYTGQSLTFTIKESEGLSNSEKTELINMANDTLTLAFEGWSEYLFKNKDFNLKNLGFLVYPAE